MCFANVSLHSRDQKCEMRNHHNIEFQPSLAVVLDSVLLFPFQGSHADPRRRQTDTGRRTGAR